MGNWTRKGDTRTKKARIDLGAGFTLSVDGPAWIVQKGRFKTWHNELNEALKSVARQMLKEKVAEAKVSTVLELRAEARRIEQHLLGLWCEHWDGENLRASDIIRKHQDG